MRQPGELVSAAVIMPGAIVPVTAILHLELNPAERVQTLFSFGRPRAENKNARLMVWLSRDMPHAENQSKVPIIILCVNHSASFTGAGHRAVLHNPSVGLVFPARERFPIEQRFHFGNLLHGAF